MDIADVLELLEKRSREHKEKRDGGGRITSPEGRIAAQIHACVSEELDKVIAEIRERVAVA